MSRLHTTRLRAWVSHFAVAALLLAQAIGLLHGATHRSSASVGITSIVDAQAQTSGHSQVSALFGGHAPDTLECRLFDHLTHSDLAPLPVVVLASDEHSAPQPVQAPRGHTPAFQRSYCARGPPAVV